MIVDDGELIRDSLCLALSDSFEVHLAENRLQPIKLLRSMDTPPQLALVDLGLPPTPHRPTEGFRLITELLAHSRSIKISAAKISESRPACRHKPPKQPIRLGQTC